METGFNNEAVRAKLRPLLKNRTTTDEELIKQTSDAVSEETERASKLSVSSRRQQAKVVVPPVNVITKPMEENRIKDIHLKQNQYKRLQMESSNHLSAHWKL